MPKRGKKKVGKGVVSEKQREGDEFFRIQFPFQPLFLLARKALPWISEESVFYSALCVSTAQRVVVFAAWKHHYSAWEKRADGRTTAGRPDML